VYDFQIMNDRFSLFDDGFKKRGRMDGNFIFFHHNVEKGFGVSDILPSL